MKKIFLLGILCLMILGLHAQYTSFKPGEIWKDNKGIHINAHGGGVLYYKDTYYWFGEHKTEGTTGNTALVGVHCYSSKDLLNWKFEGIVLPAVKEDPNHDLHPSKVLERPKVIYNKKTGKFVMWAHVESADYSKACAGVAVSDFPNGPFTYLGSFRPNNAMSRDQTVFVDDMAYILDGAHKIGINPVQSLVEPEKKADSRFPSVKKPSDLNKSES